MGCELLFLIMFSDMINVFKWIKKEICNSKTQSYFHLLDLAFVVVHNRFRMRGLLLLRVVVSYNRFLCSKKVLFLDD